MEWTVVEVLIAVVGLGATVGIPLLKLNATITVLSESLRTLRRDVEQNANVIAENKAASRESHRRLWEHNEEQDERIEGHERRIGALEIERRGNE